MERQPNSPPPDPVPDADAHRPPVPILNPLPGPVWGLLLIIAGIEGVLVMAAQGWIGGPAGLGWRLEAIQRFAFSGAIQDWMIEARRAPPRQVLRYVSYGFVQPTPMAAMFVLVMLAGLGKAIGEGLGRGTLLAVVLLPQVLAAALFGLMLRGNDLAWLIGAWPMVFGLVGAWTWMMRDRAGDDAARRRRAFGLIAVLLLARLGFGLMAETGHGWIADLAACGIGYGLAAALRPGALARLRRR